MPDERGAEEPRRDPAEVAPPSADAALTPVVVRRPPPAPATWQRRVVGWRDRWPELRRSPVVTATAAVTATVAGRVALDVARRVLSRSVVGDARVQISGVVVHHVVHHHVVHVLDHRPALPR